MSSDNQNLTPASENVAADQDGPARRLESLAALAGGVAHDFNNLLTTILGYTHLALADLPPDAAVRDFLLQVDKSARRAADLTQQLLAYAGRHVFAFQLVALSDFIRELTPLLQSIAGKNHALQLSLVDPLPAFEGDAQQLRQIVINLVTNAAESFDGPGGAITIRSGLLHLDQPSSYSAYVGPDAPPGPYVTLEVADTGRGMTKETLDRLFDPYFSTKFPGRGLGMAAVWGIVRSHRGLIKVDSVPGQGATFQVLFPAQARR
jgi:signal transduction histidine kinase